MKKLNSKKTLFLFFFMLLALPLVIFALKSIQDTRSRADIESASLSLQNNLTKAGIGLLFPVTVILDSKSVNAALLDFTVSYNPKSLKLVSFIPQSIFDNELTPNEPTQDTESHGTFRFLALDTLGESISGKRTIGTLYFRGVQPGIADITISDASFGSDTTMYPLSHETRNTVEIIDPTQGSITSSSTNIIVQNPASPTSIPVVTSQPATKVEPTTTSSGTTQNKPDSSSSNQQNNSSGNSSFWNFFKKSPTPTSNPTHTQQTTPNPTTAPQSPQTKQTQPTQQAPTSVVSCTTKAQGDANCDGKTNISDLNVWKTETASQRPQNADFNSDGKADLSDYLIWRKNAL